MTRKLKPGSYYGSTKQHCVVEGLTFAETSYAASRVIPPHEHANPFFCYLISGLTSNRCARLTWTAGPRTFMLFPAGVPHANHWHTGGRVLHVEFSPDWLSRLRDRGRVLERP